MPSDDLQRFLRTEPPPTPRPAPPQKEQERLTGFLLPPEAPPQPAPPTREEMDVEGAQLETVRRLAERQSRIKQIPYQQAMVEAQQEVTQRAGALRVHGDPKRLSVIEAAALAFTPKRTFLPVPGGATPALGQIGMQAIAAAPMAAKVYAGGTGSLSRLAEDWKEDTLKALGVVERGGTAADFMLGGFPGETDELAVLRILGTTPSAVLGEAAAQWPNPLNLWGLSEAKTLEEQFLGSTAKKRGLERGEGRGALEAWMMTTLERIEKGRGTETELSKSAIAAGYAPGSKEDWAAWGVGLAAELAVPWETGPLRLAGAAGEIGKATSAAAKLARESEQVELAMATFRAAVRGELVDVAEIAADRVRHALARGDLRPEDLPQALRELAEPLLAAHPALGRTMDEALGKALEEAAGPFGEVTRYTRELAAARAARTQHAAARATEGSATAAEEAARVQTFASGEAARGQSFASGEAARVAASEAARAEAAEARAIAAVMRRKRPLPGESQPLPKGAPSPPSAQEAAQAAARAKGEAARATKAASKEATRVALFGQERAARVAALEQEGAALATREASFARALREATVKVDKLLPIVPPRVMPTSGTLAGRLAEMIGRANPAQAKKSLFMRVTGGLASPPKIKLGPQGEAFAQVVEGAWRRKMRAVIGSDKLQSVARDVWVAPHEARRIMGAMKAATDAAGLVFKQLDATPEGVRFTAETAAAFNKFTIAAGLTPRATPGEVMDLLTYRSAIDQFAEKAAGLGSRARYVVRGTRLASDVLLGALTGATGAAINAFSKETGDHAIAMFLNLDRAGLSRPAIIALDSAMSALKTNAQTLFREVRDIAKRTGGFKTHEDLTGAMVEIMGRSYRPVPQAELELVTAAREAFKGGDAQTMDQIRQAILKGGSDPNELTMMRIASNPIDVADEVRSWTMRREKEIAKMGRLLIEAHYPKLEDPVSRLTSQNVADVYREFWVDGNLAGPAMKVVESYNGPARPGNEAILAFVLEVRADALMDTAWRRLVSEGMGIPADSPVAAAASAMMLGATHFLYRGERVALETAAEASAAFEFLRVSGLTQATERELATLNNATAPPWLVEDLKRAKRLGMIETSSVLDAKYRLAPFYNKSLRIYKYLNTTMGLGSFSLSNVVSIPFMGMRTIGPINTVRAAVTTVRHPMVAGAMVKRFSRAVEAAEELAPGQKFIPSPAGIPIPITRWADNYLDERVFLTNEGRIYSVDELVEHARRSDVNQSFLHFETAASFLEEMKRLDPAGGQYASGVALFRESAVELSQVWEVGFRTGVYLDAIKTGRSLDEAAQFARESLFDYSTLTEFERAYMRNIFLFWSFHRKNMDSMWRALANDPSRFMAQVRFYEKQRGWWGQNPEEDLHVTEAEVGAVVLGRQEQVFRPNGEIDPQKRSLLTLTNGLDTLQALFQTMRFARLFDVFGISQGQAEQTEDALKISSQLNPSLSIPLMVGAMGVEVGTGRSLTEPYTNKIPDHMMQTPGMREIATVLFQPKPYQKEAWMDPDIMHPVPGGGLGYWAVDPSDISRVRLLQAFKSTLGRSTQEGAKLIALADFLMQGKRSTLQFNPWETEQGTSRRTGLMRLLSPKAIAVLGARTKAQPFALPASQRARAIEVREEARVREVIAPPILPTR